MIRLLSGLLLALSAVFTAEIPPAVGACVAELNYQGQTYGPTFVEQGYSVGQRVGSGSIPQDCAEPGVSAKAPPAQSVSVRQVRGIRSSDAVFVQFTRGFGVYARAGYKLPATARVVVNDSWGQRRKGKRFVAVGLSLARGAVVTLRLTRGSVTVGNGRLTETGALRIRLERPIGRGAYVLAGVVAYRGVRIPLRFPFVVR